MNWVPIAISLVALAFSAINLFRSVRSTPKPRLEVEARYDGFTETDVDEDGDPYDVEQVHLAVTNYGNGNAHDVRLTLVAISGRPIVEKLGILVPGATSRGHFNYADPDVPSRGSVTMSWWEYPAGKRATAEIRYGYGD